uniref:Uncharacterized protein LOC111137538 isoform X2 n=1 Tax=Crassostrea virginica TaxID=6565 RepID=A0A8B8EXQ9_CRAVI|nr:uncharacterized protein LOC111137538 isoform X2 [Crassostrea virginica]
MHPIWETDRSAFKHSKKAPMTRLLKMIALVVMTSLLRESCCLIGLIGVRRNSPVPHPPRGIAKTEQTPRPVTSVEPTSSSRVTDPHHRLLHSFRCQTRALKSLIRDPRLNLSDTQNWVLFCSQVSEVAPSDCSLTVQHCIMTSARQLLLESGCSPISRMMSCIGNKMASCFKSPDAVTSIVRHLQSVCSRHRHAVIPLLNLK